MNGCLIDMERVYHTSVTQEFNARVFRPHSDFPFVRSHPAPDTPFTTDKLNLELV